LPQNLIVKQDEGPWFDTPIIQDSGLDRQIILFLSDLEGFVHKGAVTPDGIPAHIPAFFFLRGMRQV